MGAPEPPDHKVLREILESQEVQVHLEFQDQKAVWEKWDSQVHQDRRVFQDSQVDQDLQDSQVHLVSLDPKGNQVLLGSDHLDQLDSRVSQDSQGFQEVQD